MNWTGGHLQQSKRKQNGITAKQRSYFAKSHLRNLVAKRTAPASSFDNQHPYYKSLKLYAQETYQQALEPPEWLPKELHDSFLQTQSRPETRLRKVSTSNKHGSHQESKHILCKNGEATYLEDSGTPRGTEELENEVKRHNLLRQKDWFATSKTGYNHRPVLQDRSRIGKRRKLKQDDLTRVAVQYKNPRSKPNLNFVPADGTFKASQISIRLGSQIHGTQRTNLSDPKISVKTTSAGEKTTKESDSSLATSCPPSQPQKETPIRSIASFQALEEMVTPPRNRPTSQAQQSRVERWISESGHKGRLRGDPRSKRPVDDIQATQSPRSLDGESHTYESVSQLQRRLSYKESGRTNNRKRKSESDVSYNREPSMKLSTFQGSVQDEFKEDYMTRSSRTGVYKEQNCHLEFVKDPGLTGGRLSVSLFSESKTFDSNTTGLAAPRYATSLSSLPSKLTNSSSDNHGQQNIQRVEGITHYQASSHFQERETMPSFHFPASSASTDMPTRNGVDKNTIESSISKDSSKVSLTLAQKQNKDWLQWIMSLRQVPKENEIADASESSRQETFASIMIPFMSPTNVSPISLESTYVHTGSTPKLRTLVKEPEESLANDLECIKNHSFGMTPGKTTMAKGQNSNAVSDILGLHFETPTAQQSLDIFQPRTPAKSLIQRRSIIDGSIPEPKAINLRDKFLQIASLPC